MRNNVNALRAQCRAAALPGRDVAYDPGMLGGSSWVPYIGGWTGETDDRAAWDGIIARPDGVGIGYTDESILDRDEYGVLWRRSVNRIGVGRPLFKQTHAARQRRVMARMLCQVCAQAPDRDHELGVLWLIPGGSRDDWRGWPEGMANGHPPLCVPCARASVRLCPALRDGYVAVRARRYPISGVLGIQYVPGAFRPRMVGGGIVEYADPAVYWVQAAQLVRTLGQCTIVDMDRL